METRGKRASGAPGTPALAAEVPVAVEAPVETQAIPDLPRLAAPSDPQPSAERPTPDEIGKFGYDTLAAFAESQTAMTRGLEAISDEVAGMTRTGLGIVALAATEMLGVKTIADAFRVNALFARKSLDSLLDGSAKLSGLGLDLAAESSRPILTHLGQRWIEAARHAL